MIHMPHRSVTRFFVPLIDVLLLLFCIFLLMPFANEDEMEKTQDEAAREKELATVYGYEVDRLDDTVKTMERIQSTLQTDPKAYEELEKKYNDLLKKLSPNQRFVIHMIDIDRETGELYSINSRGLRTHIKDEKAAKKLIDDDRRAADSNDQTKDKPLYYCFIYPRPQDAGRPTEKQINKYKEWFGNIDNVEISFLKGAPP